MYSTAQLSRRQPLDHMDLAQGFIELCKRGEPIAKLNDALRTALDRLDFRYFACCSHVDPLDPPPSAVMLHNYPTVWANTFSENRLYEYDPMLLRAEQSPFPFHWNNRAFRAQHTEKQIKLLAAASSLGLRSGYTIPIHLSWVPGAVRASCSLVPASDSIDSRNYFTAELLSTYFYASATTPYRPKTRGAPLILSQRERQCLELAGQGKCDWTIAQLLGISKGTAHKCIERIKRRLGVATRVQAIIKAFAAGQISCGDVIRVGSREAAEWDAQKREEGVRSVRSSAATSPARGRFMRRVR
jgi:DNA-binding CsgD family transcriptional regulator